MIVGVYFPGDANDRLKWIQHDLYGELIFHLFHHARERYLHAARLVRMQTDLSRRIATIDSFDHRVLQDAHDTIAAYYRFAIDPRGQVPLFHGGVTYEQHLQIEWRGFYLDEVEQLAEDDEIARAILTAVAYENADPGYAAEQWLRQLLHERYGRFGPLPGDGE